MNALMVGLLMVLHTSMTPAGGRSGAGVRHRDASGSDESGRGLLLVESLAES